MTPDAVLAADERAKTAARLCGAAQALGVLDRRSPDDQWRACMFAMDLLQHVDPATDWTAAGLPQRPRQGPRQGQGQGQPGGRRAGTSAAADPAPVAHRAVLCLARTAMTLYSAGLRISERPAHWARLTHFYAARLPARDPELARLRERTLTAQLDAGDTSAKVFGGLLNALDFHRDVHGEDGYLTSIARYNLALAYRHRRTGADLATATALAEKEARTRAASYGPLHPMTLVARSLLTLVLLLRAEDSADERERHRLASRALGEVAAVRAARDRLYGVTSPNATKIRRYEARALLLLGEPERARTSLEYTLAFEKAHNAGQEAQEIADTHYQLARANRILGELDTALSHARQASRIFELHNPAGRSARLARELITELRAGRPGRLKG